MDKLVAVLIVFAVILSVGAWISLFFLGRYLLRKRKENREESIRYESERESREAEEKKEMVLRDFRSRTAENFHVEFDRINEKGTQDEIVRTVNLLASKAAEICVRQSSDLMNYHYDQEVSKMKKAWFEARNLAIEICPELEARMPHFGEFEPLKSYNAEHLIQAPK